MGKPPGRVSGSEGVNRTTPYLQRQHHEQNHQHDENRSRSRGECRNSDIDRETKSRSGWPCSRRGYRSRSGRVYAVKSSQIFGFYSCAFSINGTDCFVPGPRSADTVEKKVAKLSNAPLESWHAFPRIMRAKFLAVELLPSPVPHARQKYE